MYVKTTVGRKKRERLRLFASLYSPVFFFDRLKSVARELDSSEKQERLQPSYSVDTPRCTPRCLATCTANSVALERH